MKESDIRPNEIFDEFLLLASKDILKYFSEPGEIICCPACDAKGDHAFTKDKFSYRECASCKTLFVSPRPSEESFSRYYQESESSKYWASTFYKATADARREKLWKPKVQLIHDVLIQYGSELYDLVDIGGGFGIFGEEYEKAYGKRVFIIEPGPDLAKACREKGLEVIQSFMEDITHEQLSDGPKNFVSFELFEHLYDPKKFLTHLFHLMKSGDLFIFTTLSGVGVDIRVLWENSKSVSPPHHLNFFNPKSIRLLLNRIGFEVLQTSTPGKLDIDIMSNNTQFVNDRFWKTFLYQATQEEKTAMQILIAECGLSSHMLTVCRKP